MTLQTQQSYLSPDEYLELERQSPFRHEYRQGLIYAMAGTKKFHAQIAYNLSFLLGNHLADVPCSIYIADIKVRIESANCYYYPDISVTCDKRDVETNDDFILAPHLIIEVLSKSTEQFDRTDKFFDYQQIPALKDYVLISSEQVQAECYHKQLSDEWIKQRYGLGEMVTIPSVDFKCRIEEIYNKVLGLLNQN
jgi:Uma2 family endonuclease